jgi:hypothetical protein
MAASTSYKEIVKKLREAGYSDGMIAVEMQRHLPGGAIPSLNSIRRWRYGKAAPSKTYAVVLDLLYKDMVSRGLIK